MPRLPLLVLALASLAGCSAFGPSASDVSFETTSTVYDPGDEVTARLVNTTSGMLGYNLCFTTVEVRRGSWERVDVTGESGLCNDIQYRLNSGEEARRVVVLPDDFLPGKYRLTTDVEFEGGERVEVTARFEVR